MKAVALLAALLVLSSCGGADRGSRGGGICGDPALEGRRVSRVTSPIAGCGIDAPVEVTRVAGVALSQPAVLDCSAARALSRWTRDAVLPTLGKQRGGLRGIQVIAHYACRPRNNRSGAKVSEHGRGKALDISGFYFADGSRLDVLRDWDSSRRLRRLHGKACGPFGTVLGPESDRWHQDHIHVDTASYRGGPYCR